MGLKLRTALEISMTPVNSRRDTGRGMAPTASPGSFLQGYSIEVMPRTAAKIDDFRTLLPKETRVYVAHIEGTPIEEMVKTSRRLARDGFGVMPHFPARIIPDIRTLRDWIRRYQGEAGIDQALLLAGGVAKPAGDYDSSMQLLETGLFDEFGFRRLHVAGHPEGNRDIDPDGSDRNVMEALRWKQAFSERTDARIALVTQFAFESGPIVAWVDRLAREGIRLPVHIGIAGPAKLQTLIKFAIACGVGKSLKVLQKRATDLTRLVRPYEPTELITELAAHKTANPDFGIEQVHLFPLGGIGICADWVAERGGTTVRSANAA